MDIEPPPTIRADSFIIARAPGTCYSCNAPGEFICLIVPPGHQRVDDHDSDGGWVTVPDFSALTWVSGVSEDVLGAIQEISPHWRLGHSNTLGDDVFMNHCTQCGAHQGDFYLHRPEMPFFPMDDIAAAEIRTQIVSVPLEVNASYTDGGMPFEIGDNGNGRLPVYGDDNGEDGAKPRKRKKKQGTA